MWRSSSHRRLVLRFLRLESSTIPHLRDGSSSKALENQEAVPPLAVEVFLRSISNDVDPFDVAELRRRDGVRKRAIKETELPR